MWGARPLPDILRGSELKPGTLNPKPRLENSAVKETLKQRSSEYAALVNCMQRRPQQI